MPDVGIFREFLKVDAQIKELKEKQEELQKVKLFVRLMPLEAILE